VFLHHSSKSIGMRGSFSAPQLLIHAWSPAIWLPPQVRIQYPQARLSHTLKIYYFETQRHRRVACLGREIDDDLGFVSNLGSFV
jgi:hypothetical protein